MGSYSCANPYAVLATETGIQLFRMPPSKRNVPVGGRIPIKRILWSFLVASNCLACGLAQDISFDKAEAEPAEGPSVIVVWGETEAEVFLDDLDKIPVEGSLACSLWDILLAAGLEEEAIRSICFDFEAQDGFRPSSVGCECLEAETLELGYLVPDSMALVWDSRLALRGCYWVNQVTRILGEPA
jgi:hypothetical protein